MQHRVISTLALAALVLAPPAAIGQSQSLTADRRAAIVRDLEASQARFLASINGLSEAQWRFKSAPERWSIAEVAEHLTLVEQNLGDLIRTKLQAIPAFTADSAAKLEAAVRGLYGDRTRRFNAADVFVPTGKWATQAEWLAAYREARKANVDFVQGTEEPLRSRGAPHPAFGTLDGVAWLAVISAHMDRHVHQIEDVKKAGGYPRN
jgi:DinB superfamily